MTELVKCEVCSLGCYTVVAISIEGGVEIYTQGFDNVLKQYGMIVEYEERNSSKIYFGATRTLGYHDGGFFENERD